MKLFWKFSCLLNISSIIIGGMIQQTCGKRPNIIVLMSDDQDLLLGSMDVMQYTKRLIKSYGATLHNAFTTSPICCPSRSSFLTGMYSHNHNVLTNRINCSSQQWRDEFETRTFATYLQRSGYTTSYFGKYLNEYNGSYVPPGWHHWVGLIKNTKYYNYTLRLNDIKESHKDNYEEDYFTDLIVNRSMEYFRGKKLEDPEKPILSFLSFPAPHGSEDGAPQYQHLYQNASSHITPSFDYGPNLDKHWIISRINSSMDDVQHRFSTMLQQKRLQTLRSVDDGVKKLVEMLEQVGELDNTYLLYTSDHGYHIGQFRLAKGKGTPYDFDIRIPFFVRGPGIPQNFSVDNIVLNIDIAPTLLSIAGVPVPDSMDGRNFLDLLHRAPADGLPWRDTFLVERGKIPLTKIHLAKPRLPSKQEKVDETCRGPDYQQPCARGQVWTCAMDNGRLKIRKCSKIRKIRSATPKSSCSCATTKYKKISNKCRRLIQQEVKKGRNRVHINPNAKSAASAVEQLKVMMHNVSSPNSLTTCRLTYSKREARIQCVQGSQPVKPVQMKKSLKNLRMQIRILELFLKCRSQHKRPCKCSKKKTSRKKVSRNPVEHPMKRIVKEMQNEYQQRLQTFRQSRLAQASHASKNSQQSHGKARRPLGRCSLNGMTCFRLTPFKWSTPPVWDGPERCYCTGSTNGTYWCIRTLNETANLLYCEFITGFVEYYDMNKDPYQLSNTYHDLSAEVRTALNRELAQLRVCKGARNCHIQRGVQPSEIRTTTMPTEPATEENVLNVTAPESDHPPANRPKKKKNQRLWNKPLW